MAYEIANGLGNRRLVSWVIALIGVMIAFVWIT
jgi:hypothetical protein